nr:Chain P, Peptide from Serine acetyltransferase [Haemophilus influenzae Rd KW20]7YOL_B Chain B, Peptide from Serine acetyltransferase [Haemophilus influenzae Rd KW20]
DGMNLNI